MRLQLPGWSPNQEIASFRLAWDAPGTTERQSLIEHLTLPVKEAAELDGLDTDMTVAEQFALLESNRARRRATEQLDLGDIEAGESSLDTARALFAAMPGSQLSSREMRLLKEKRTLLRQDRNLSRRPLSRKSLRSSKHVWEESVEQN